MVSLLVWVFEMIGKDYADRILNNTKEVLIDAHYFKYTDTMCRDLEKVRVGIKNGFIKED